MRVNEEGKEGETENEKVNEEGKDGETENERE
jgi:hypothetical protein